MERSAFNHDRTRPHRHQCLISYPLSPHQPGVIRAIVSAFLEETFVLLLPEDLLRELVVTIRTKPQLATRILPEELEAFVDILETYGETVATIEDPIPAVTRDPKDDYLLAYALVGGADYLVTGDKDLLALEGQLPGMMIVTPAAFAQQMGYGSTE